MDASWVRKLIHALGLLALFGLPPRVVAASSPSECPPAAFRLLVPNRADQQSVELDRLAVLAEVCDTRYDFHAQRGALLLQLQRFQEAAVSLEKALLINPELAGAQIDYAQALAALGQRVEAIDLLEQVAKRPDIESSLRDWLRREIELAAKLERLQPARRDPLLGSIDQTPADLSLGGIQSLKIDAQRSIKLSGAVQTAFGRESNLTGASHLRELTLYLINGPVLVPLSEAQAPVAGLTQRSSLALQATARAASTEVQIAGLVQARRALNEPVPAQQFARLELQAAFPFGNDRLSAGISEQNLEQGVLFAAKDRKYALSYLFNLYQGACHPSVSVSHSALSYAFTPSMNGVFRVLRGELTCTLFGELKVGATLGLDEPTQSGRPGGDRKHYDLYARHTARFHAPLFGKPLRAIGWARAARSMDGEVFSDLLATNPADTRRIDAGLGVSWPLSKRLELSAEFETNSQQSSNPLLNLKNRSLYLALRWQSD